MIQIPTTPRPDNHQTVLATQIQVGPSNECLLCFVFLWTIEHACIVLSRSSVELRKLKSNEIILI